MYISYHRDTSYHIYNLYHKWYTSSSRASPRRKFQGERTCKPKNEFAYRMHAGRLVRFPGRILVCSDVPSGGVLVVASLFPWVIWCVVVWCGMMSCGWFRGWLEDWQCGWSWDVMLSDIKSCDVVWCRVRSCCVMCCDVMQWDGMGCDVMWCDEMWLCDLLNW